MLEDLATLAPSVIVCVAFLWGIWALIRHEMAPKRVAREDDREDDLDSAPTGEAVTSATESGDAAAARSAQRGEL